MDSRRNIIAVGLASVLAFLLTRIVLGAQGDGFGKAYWQPNGVPLCLAPGLQGIPHVTSDGDGGLITAWTDCRSPLTGCDIYAQRVASSGAPGGTAMPASRVRPAPGGAAAAISHAASVGGRAPARRAWASASYRLTWVTGSASPTGRNPLSVNWNHAPSTGSHYSGARQPRSCTVRQPSDNHSSGRA